MPFSEYISLCLLLVSNYIFVGKSDETGMGQDRIAEVGPVFQRNDLLAPLACSEIRSKTGRTRRPFVPL